MTVDPATQLIRLASGARFDGDVRFGGAGITIRLGDSTADQVRTSGDLTVGADVNIAPGGVIEFGDGTVQSTAAVNSGPAILTASVTVDESVIIGASFRQTTVTIPGADVGDVVVVSSDITEPLTNIRVTRARVVRADEVRFTVFYNVVFFDPPAITFKIAVFD